MENFFGILLLVVLAAIGFQRCRDEYFMRRTEVVVTRQRGVRLPPPAAPVADGIRQLRERQQASR